MHRPVARPSHPVGAARWRLLHAQKSETQPKPVAAKKSLTLHSALKGLPTDPSEQAAVAGDLFDRDYYLATNGDVRAAGCDPLRHYLSDGWRELRNPRADLSTRAYLQAFPELEPAEVSPLLHAAWLARQPVNPEIATLFDVDYYLSTHPELRGSGVDPMWHYLLRGWKDGADPSRSFSTQHYLSQQPQLSQGEVSPLEHFVAEGMPDTLELAPDLSLVEQAGQKRHGFWNSEFQALLKSLGYDMGPFSAYGPQVSEIIAAMFSPDHHRRRTNRPEGESDLGLLTRYLVFDLPGGEPPGPLFDTDHYLRELTVAGLPAPNVPPFLDWLKRGLGNGISPTPAFDPAEYAMMNPGLSEASASNFSHWLLHGLREGRQFMRAITLGTVPAGGNGDRRPLGRIFAEDAVPAATADLATMRAFRDGAFEDLIAEARTIEPLVGGVQARLPAYLPPWHDTAYLVFKACVDRLPEGPWDSVVAMPFCKMGGADFVAGILTSALARRGLRPLVLRTEQPDWERPDWFPDNVATVDLSDLLTQVDAPTRALILHALLHHVGARRFFNVNSRAAYEMLVRLGTQLSRFVALYNYYFCADRRPDGSEVGYAIDYFAAVQGRLDCALIDNADFAAVLVNRHALTPEMARRVQPIYSPAMEMTDAPAVVDRQIESRDRRQCPRILWAGRFDRQKRFDLVQDIARLLPDCEFLCWGKAVLDQPPDLSSLPPNMTLMGTYVRLDELPLDECDGWLYTSGWDGLPTVLIEIAAQGMPVVASAVGGVPELVDHVTGWPVDAGATAEDYALTVQDMLADPDERRRRAHALMQRARARHSFNHYCSELDRILSMEGAA